MRKKLLAILAVLSVVSLVFAFAACDKEGENEEYEPFVTYNFEHIDILQTGSDSYDFTVKSDAGETAEFYVTISDKFNKDKAYKAESTYADGKHTFNLTFDKESILTPDTSEFFLWAIDGEKQGQISLMLPAWSPKLTLKEDTDALIEFNFDGETSWSSFCDPQGINIYSSENVVFDDKATPVAEGLQITLTSYTDRNYTLKKPFYFMVLDAKNGVVRIVSNAFADTSATLESATATMVLENEKPVLKVSGRSALPAELGYDFRLMIRESGGEVFYEDNQGSGQQLEYSFDLTQLTVEGVWYDVLIEVVQTGVAYDLSFSMAEDVSVEYEKTDATYSFKDYEGMLKVTFMVNRLDILGANFEMRDEKPVMVVKAKVYGESPDAVQLQVRYFNGLLKHKVENTGTETDMEFVYDLTKMSREGDWHDIVLVVTEGEKTVDYNLNKAHANMDQTITYEDRKYSFKEYEGDLKVTFEKTTVEIQSAVLEMRDDKPVMVVKAKAESAVTNVKLEIRYSVEGSSSKKKLTVENSGTDTELEFVFDLTQVKVAKEGDWSDIIVRVGSVDKNVKEEHVADMSKTLTYDGIIYSFQQWDGDLKIMWQTAK